MARTTRSERKPIYAIFVGELRIKRWAKLKTRHENRGIKHRRRRFPLEYCLEQLHGRNHSEWKV